MASSNYEYDRGWKKLLPIGFHFLPTDEELNMYLKLKSCDGNIPPEIFTDLDIYEYEPQQLSGFAENHWDGRMYFFAPLRKKYDNGARIGRTIHSGKGYWKATQSRKNLCKKDNFNKQTACESSFQVAKKEGEGDVIIGTKTSLVYHEYRPKTSTAKKTSWLMLEYRFPIKFDPLPLFNGTNHELTLCVIYYHTKKNDDNQIAMLTQSDDPNIPLQTSINQNLDHSPYTPHQENPYSYPNNFVSNDAPIQQYQPLTSRVTTSSSPQQYQPLINKTADTFERWPVEHSLSQIHIDVATTSTMQPSFPQLPYDVMENLDIFPPIPQNSDFHGFDPSISQYFNFDNFPYIGDEEIGHIPNSNTDFVDQNKLSTLIPQDDQRPSSDNQDHQQLKMKKIKI
ncbi:hypothetical protein HAX54_031373 [Datura stramonium]|uniref:NAC domain-containing protein n=1 Tax=Datura stramonium TaxID=4076 RepID=A0ABS8V948_DATST|nr:hypothetical protein [Datura stramonium]